MPTRHVLPFLLFPLFLSPVRADGPCPCAPDLAGPWKSGTWLSQSTGHTGPLSATFERLNPTQYRVVFRGRFCRFIPFRYSVTLDIVGHEGACVLLAGSSKLPLFGTFRYNARASACDFVATYTSHDDTGTFTLRR